MIGREVVHGVGHLTLDRPQALNALDLTMVRLLRAALEDWCQDPAVNAVVIDSSSPRAFCAGGDIRAVRAAAVAGDALTGLRFLAEEYQLNRRIAEYPKPFIALIDGHCLGGGLGVSVHGAHRVVTERARLAMPETAIGFFPDIGASHFLPRLPGRTGRLLGLTGVRAVGGDAVHVGLATHYVPSTELAALRAALLDGADVDAALRDFAQPPPVGELTVRRPEIDHCFGPGSIPEVRSRLVELAGDWATGRLAELAAASPLSLLLTDELLERGAHDDLSGCLARELALAGAVVAGTDFDEGVRALLVDKDGRPHWSEGAKFDHALAEARVALAG